MRALRRNLAYKLLSLALGILLYAVAFQQNNPRTSQDQTVQPEIEKLPDNMALKALPVPVTVTISGNAVALQAFRDQSIKATVDLSHAQAGVNRLPIRYRHDAGLVDLTGPSFVEVTLDKKTFRTFPIMINSNETAPPGFAYKEAIIKPRQVRVRGAASEIDKVEYIVAQVDNNGPFTGDVELVAQNKSRQAMDTVEIIPPKATVTLEVKTAPASKTLVLSPDFTGTAAKGFLVTGCTFDPASITVAGAFEQLINRSRLPVPVDISGVRASVSRVVTVPLPPGIRAIDPEGGRATLRLEVAAIAAPSPAAPAATPSPAATPNVPPVKETP